MTLSISVLLTTFFFCFTGIASAAEFSADAVMHTQGQRSTSKIHIKDKKMCMEAPGQPGYSIMRGDKNIMWTVMPSRKAYMEIKPDPSKKPQVEEKVRGEVSRKLIGSETIDGHPTQKYEITSKLEGKTNKVHQWIATDIKFPIKTAATDGSWSMEYKNIKIGRQSDSLFEIPAGYTKMEMPAMPKGFKIPKTK